MTDNHMVFFAEIAFIYGGNDSSEKDVFGSEKSSERSSETTAISSGTHPHKFLDKPSGKAERSIAHYDMRFLKPIDEEILEEVGKKFKKVITVENGTRQGGLGSAVLEWMNDHGYAPKVTRLGLPDKFVEHGTVKELQHIVGIDEEGIKKAILEA